ncbi:hypothetical protein IAU60_006695 [Kwoniella sp. DSM 27419]
MTSLADELAGAFDHDLQLDPVGGLSLADEFGLDEGDISEEAQGSHPSRATVTPATVQGASGRHVRSASQETRQLEYRCEEGSSHAQSLQDQLGADGDRHDAPTGSPPRLASSQASSRSLRPRPSRRQLDPDHAYDPSLGQEALIVLSETVGAGARLLRSLRELDTVRDRVVASPVRGGAFQVGLAGLPVEDRLERHLARMEEAEKRREAMIRELSRELSREDRGLIPPSSWTGDGGESEVGVRVDPSCLQEEGDAGWTGGWTGELEVDAELSGYRQRGLHGGVPDAYQGDMSQAEDPLMASLDAMLEDGMVTRSHRRAADAASQRDGPTDPRVPALLQLTSLVCSDTTALIHLLQTLQDTLHTSSSLSTGISRSLRGIRSAVDSCKSHDAEEREARRRVDQWEEAKVRDGLRGTGLVERMRVECEEFEAVLEGYGERLRRLNVATAR